MSRKFFFEDAVDQGIIHVGDHFVTTVMFDVRANIRREESGISEIQTFEVREGEEKIWRLEDGFKMLGTPTKENLTLRGIDGYENSIMLMDRIISATNIMPGVFKTVKACAFSKPGYKNMETPERVKQICQEAEKYNKAEDKNLSYWLASRFMLPEQVGTHVSGNYGLFIMKQCSFSQAFTYQAYVGPCPQTYPLRPEATPEPKLIIETDGLDGSKNKPWRCIC